MMNRLFALVELARPRQWSKNLVLFGALLFSGAFLNAGALGRAALGFLAFVLVSASVYAANDVLDRAGDRRHPLKRLRPVASGRVSPALATAFSVLLAAAALALSSALGWGFLAVTVCYLLATTAYSLWLKHIVILDVFLIAFNFVLRAVGGGVAISVPISEWLLLCTTLLALFIALAKRRHELTLLQGRARSHRRALEGYSPALLDQLITVAASATVVAYALYTVFGAKPAESIFGVRLSRGYPLMMLTVPFVLYGIFRYLYLVHRKGQGGSPESVLLNDRSMGAAVGLWSLCSAAILLLAK